jgi:glutaredoxin
LSTRPGPPDGPTEVTVVESPSCHFCADAHQALDQLAADGHTFRVVTLDVREPAGQDLMRQHGAGMSPLVLVNGEFFSQGRLPRRKLTNLLERSNAATVVESHGA